jgi:hypothetical protein
MRQPAVAVFAFTENGDVVVFPSLPAAAAWMEAIDIDDGEYVAMYGEDGRIIRAATRDDCVVLTPTEDADLPALRLRLRRLRLRERGLIGDEVPEEPGAVAARMLAREWEQRWPRWPRWLDNWLHGDGPSSVYYGSG